MAQSKTQRHAEANVQAEYTVVERHDKNQYHRQRA